MFAVAIQNNIIPIYEQAEETTEDTDVNERVLKEKSLEEKGRCQ